MKPFAVCYVCMRFMCVILRDACPDKILEIFLLTQEIPNGSNGSISIKMDRSLIKENGSNFKEIRGSVELFFWVRGRPDAFRGVYFTWENCLNQVGAAGSRSRRVPELGHFWPN